MWQANDCLPLTHVSGFGRKTCQSYKLSTVSDNIDFPYSELCEINLKVMSVAMLPFLTHTYKIIENSAMAFATTHNSLSIYSQIAVLYFLMKTMLWKNAHFPVSQCCYNGFHSDTVNDEKLTSTSIHDATSQQTAIFKTIQQSPEFVASVQHTIPITQKKNICLSRNITTDWMKNSFT